MNAKISGWEIALHAVLEGGNVFAVLDELGDDFVPRSISSMLVDIPAQASRIVAQTVSLWV
jgi:hypothetical protein